MKDKEDLHQKLKAILGTPRRRIHPYEDSESIFKFQKENESHITYEISVQTGHSDQAQTNQSNRDIILKEEDEIDLESDQDENQVIDDIKNEEIESEDDLEFDVKREPNGKSNSYTRDR